jgi:hypothetical protein
MDLSRNPVPSVLTAPHDIHATYFKDEIVNFGQLLSSVDVSFISESHGTSDINFLRGVSVGCDFIYQKALPALLEQHLRYMVGQDSRRITAHLFLTVV